MPCCFGAHYVGPSSQPGDSSAILLLTIKNPPKIKKTGEGTLHPILGRLYDDRELPRRRGRAFWICHRDRWADRRKTWSPTTSYSWWPTDHHQHDNPGQAKWSRGGRLRSHNWVLDNEPRSLSHQVQSANNSKAFPFGSKIGQLQFWSIFETWADSPLAQTWPTAKKERGTGSFPQTLLSYLTLRLSALFNICTMQAIVRLCLKDFIFYNLRVGFERFPSSPLRQACFGSSSTASLHSSWIWTWKTGTYSLFLFRVRIIPILFYRAGVYWIYILSIHHGCLKGNFQYTTALEKGMAIHCLESGWIRKYAPLCPRDCLRGGQIF